MVQWTERARLEAHPENAAPYNVLLGRIGAERLAQLGRDPFREGREPGPLPGCLWFEETGHNVCDQEPNNGFMTYWQSHGLQLQNTVAYARSLALFGLPLTVAQPETSSTGEQLITQWFERARFEWHPNNPSQSRVLLGLLGNETLALNATASPVGATMSSSVIDMAASAGVNWVRVGNIDWPKVEPTPGARDWDAHWWTRKPVCAAFLAWHDAGSGDIRRTCVGTATAWLDVWPDQARSVGCICEFRARCCSTLQRAAVQCALLGNLERARR